MQHQALESLEGTPIGGSFALGASVVAPAYVAIFALGLIGLIGLISPGCGQPS
jgi:hypothetical protein